jgi:hypothetical protein
MLMSQPFCQPKVAKLPLHTRNGKAQTLWLEGALYALLDHPRSSGNWKPGMLGNSETCHRRVDSPVK